jgi:hypothetical protein
VTCRTSMTQCRQCGSGRKVCERIRFVVGHGKGAARSDDGRIPPLEESDQLHHNLLRRRNWCIPDPQQSVGSAAISLNLLGATRAGASNHALRTQRLRMDRHQTHAAEQTAWGSACKRPSRAQWHLLGPPLRCSIARPARDLWSPHHLLQSLRAVAAGWRLGPDHGCTGRRS